MRNRATFAKPCQTLGVAFLTRYKALILLVLQGGFFNYLLNDLMTSRETAPFFLREPLACFDSSRSGSMERGEVCAHEVSNALNGTKKKI